MTHIVMDRIAEALRSPGIIGGWVFGSAVDGSVRPGGDVDVGVLFAEPPGLDVVADCRLRLQEALGFDDIDLAPLNDASAILRFEALSGRRVYCADESRCAEFASLTAREYEDEMGMLQRAMRLRATPPGRDVPGDR